MISKATDRHHSEVHPLVYKGRHLPFCCLVTVWLHVTAPDVAALALSGDWTAEFLSGTDSASTPGVVGLGDAADADWTREFIAEAAGILSFLISTIGHSQ